jgi:N utilization substance protein A
VVVRSNNPKVDPIGACVGVKGSRVRPIINELQGERIDLVAYAQENAAFIANAMAPVKPLLVRILSQEDKRAEVIVSDDQLALAIGKMGQNVRLANKLTGWSLDVRSEGQKREAAQANAAAAVDELSQLEGVGPKTADLLQKGGWGDVKRLANAKADDLTALSGVGEKTAENIIAAARAYLAQKAEAAATAPAGEETPATAAPEPAVEPAPEIEAPEAEAPEENGPAAPPEPRA